jgi:hypothetical protein
VLALDVSRCRGEISLSTGRAAAAIAEPPTDVTVTEQDFAFVVDGEFQAGPQWVEIVNDGTQPHFTALVRSPVSVTMEQVMQLLQMPEGATPAPDSGLPNPEEFVDAGHAATQSAGTTTWHHLDLEAGTYILICFFPDQQSGAPHAALGMVDVITVG